MEIECKSCNQHLPREAFYKRKKKDDKCKKCWQEGYDKIYDKLLAENHPRQCTACKKVLPLTLFRKDGRGRFKTDCKFCIDSSPEIVFNKYKRDSRRREINFELTKEYFFKFQGKPCHYCGEKFQKIRLDRKDNNIGYVKGNVVSCCWPCNILKGSFDVKFFLNRASKIYIYQNRIDSHDK